jgi:hypothetical protein
VCSLKCRVRQTLRNKANSPAGGSRETADWIRSCKRDCETLLATSIATVRSEKRVWSPAFRRLHDRVNVVLRTGRASARDSCACETKPIGGVSSVKWEASSGADFAKRSQFGRVASAKFEVSSGADRAKRSQFRGGREPAGGRLGSFVQIVRHGQMRRIVLIMIPLLVGSLGLLR